MIGNKKENKFVSFIVTHSLQSLETFVQNLTSKIIARLMHVPLRFTPQVLSLVVISFCSQCVEKTTFQK